MMVKDFYFPLLERLNSVGREYFARQKLLTGKQVFKIDGLECNRVELINGVLYLFDIEIRY